MGSSVAVPQADWLDPSSIGAIADALAWPPVLGWQRRAACRGVDPELFFGRTTRSAQALCRSCPVVLECLVAAIRNDLAATEWSDCEKGVWGFATAG
jgi:hypothetical protein